MTERLMPCQPSTPLSLLLLLTCLSPFITSLSRSSYKHIYTPHPLSHHPVYISPVRLLGFWGLLGFYFFLWALVLHGGHGAYNIFLVKTFFYFSVPFGGDGGNVTWNRRCTDNRQFTSLHRLQIATVGIAGLLSLFVPRGFCPFCHYAFYFLS